MHLYLLTTAAAVAARSRTTEVVIDHNAEALFGAEGSVIKREGLSEQTSEDVNQQTNQFNQTSVPLDAKMIYEALLSLGYEDTALAMTQEANMTLFAVPRFDDWVAMGLGYGPSQAARWDNAMKDTRTARSSPELSMADIMGTTTQPLIFQPWSTNGAGQSWRTILWAAWNHKIVQNSGNAAQNRASHAVTALRRQMGYSSLFVTVTMDFDGVTGHQFSRYLSDKAAPGEGSWSYQNAITLDAKTGTTLRKLIREQTDIASGLEAKFQVSTDTLTWSYAGGGYILNLHDQFYTEDVQAEGSVQIYVGTTDERHAQLAAIEKDYKDAGHPLNSPEMLAECEKVFQSWTAATGPLEHMSNAADAMVMAHRMYLMNNPGAIDFATFEATRPDLVGGMGAAA